MPDRNTCEGAGHQPEALDSQSRTLNAVPGPVTLLTLVAAVVGQPAPRAWHQRGTSRLLPRACSTGRLELRQGLRGRGLLWHESATTSRTGQRGNTSQTKAEYTLFLTNCDPDSSLRRGRIGANILFPTLMQGHWPCVLTTYHTYSSVSERRGIRGPESAQAPGGEQGGEAPSGIDGPDADSCSSHHHTRFLRVDALKMKP